MKRTALSQRRGGFTLLELLVVVGIIAVLLAMLVPAVQKLREAANRTQCVNNLRQIGMAMTNHFGTHQSFPTNGWVLPSNGLIPGTTAYFQYGLSSAPANPPPTYMWGMGDPTQGPKTQTGSWAFSILPFMEEGNTFGSNSIAYGSNGNFYASVPLFMCPSRGRANLPLSNIDPYWTSPQQWYYNASWSPMPGGQATTPLPPPPAGAGWAKTDYAGNYLMIPNGGTTNLSAFGGSRSYPIAPADIKDGAANTIVVGEKALFVDAYNTGGWYWDEPIFAGGSGGTSRGVVAPPSPPAPLPNTNWGTPFYSQQAGFPLLAFNYPPGMVTDRDPNMFNNFGSPHPGGVNFLFADGSVRTFNYNVDPSLFRGLLTPAGGDPTPPES